MNDNRLDGISVIVCTCKHRFIGRIFDNFLRQDLDKKELIIVLNNDSLILSDYQKRAEPYSNIHIYQLPECTSLGLCLNYGIEHSNYGYITKSDDDDYYGAGYLSEIYHALKCSNGDIVGKTLSYIYYCDQQLLYKRKQLFTNRLTSWIAGGTLSFSIDVYKKIQFTDCSLGEDRQFLLDSSSLGYRIYCTSEYNYMYCRYNKQSNHTWKVSPSGLTPSTQYIIAPTHNISYDDAGQQISKSV